MRPYYSLPAYKNLVIPLFSPRARRTGGWRGGGKLGDRDAVAIDILEEIGFERDSRSLQLAQPSHRVPEEARTGQVPCAEA